MSSQVDPLPEGWTEAPLSQIAQCRMGKTILRKQLSESGVPVYSAGAANQAWGYVRKSDLVFDARTVVISARGTIGAPKVPQEPHFVSTQTTIAATCSSPITARYVAHALWGVDWSTHTSTTTIPMLTIGELDEVTLRLAPLNEQRRIVAKIEELTAKSRRAKEALEAIPPLLERFRQSVLAAAFRGDLTADWRAQNPDAEPAEQLLARIHKERRARWEEAELAKMKAKGKEPKNDKWKAKYREPEPIDTDRLPTLPTGWSWTSLGDLAAVVDPNPSHRYPDYEEGSVPLLSTREFYGRDSWDVKNAPKVPTAFWEFQYERCGFHATDIVLARKGRLGLARRLPPLGRFTFSHTIFILKPEERLFSEYLLWFLRDPAVVEWLLREMNSNTGVPTLGKAFLERLPVPVPPNAEQEAVARMVSELFGRLDEVEAAEGEARSLQATLAQAILAKAFRGELVPQDPNDEPASVLLERIRQEREKAKPKNKTRGRRAKQAAT